MLGNRLLLSGARFVVLGILTGAVCLPLGAGAGLSAGEIAGAAKPEEKIQGGEAPEITIELEKKTFPKKQPPVAPPPEASVQPKPKGERFESFEDLKDPFEAHVNNLPQLNDPFERYNRGMYAINESLYEYILNPMARGYSRMVPEDGRVAVKNAFDNAASPVSLFSSLVQGDVGKTARVLGRLIINTTVGVGGMFDVAENHFGIKPVREDFDRALERYGIPTGPYIVLPFFGPATARHAVGRAVDSIVNPANYFAPFAANLGSSVGEKVNAFSFHLDAKKDLDENAIDPYESVKHFYYEHRENLLKE